MFRSRFASSVVLTAAIVLPDARAGTGTFIDRELPTDIRIANYNVLNDNIFADTNATRAARFTRIAAAVNADVWTLQEVYNHTTTEVRTLFNSIAPLPGGAQWNVYKSTEHVIVSRYPLSLTASDTSPQGYRAVAMGLVNLPDATYPRDLYVMNAHYKCCDGFDPERQMQSDAFVNWMRDARTAGGSITLAANTPMLVVGDLNLVDGPQPLTTLLDGNIVDNATYGSDSAPDWDGSSSADASPLHNTVGPQNYTWRDDSSSFNPARLDYVVYTDSVISAANRFVLNTVTMSADDLAAAGMQQYDVSLNNTAGEIDHYPVIVDFRMNGARTLFWNAGTTTWNATNTNWLNGSASATFASGDVVRFASVGVGTVTVQAAGVAPGAMLVSNNTGTYRFVGGAISGAGAITKSGSGTLILSNPNSYTGGTTVAAGVLVIDHPDAIGLGALQINAPARASATPGLLQAVRASSVSIASGGKLDLTDNDLVINYTGTSPLSDTTAMLATGYSSGSWNGTGITSSAAAGASTTSTRTALGIAEATDLFTTFPAAFAGRSVDSTSLLIRYTLVGDATLDGTVNGADFNLLASNFGSASQRWARGDFTWDGTVNSADFNALAANFGKTFPGGPGSTVPEPAFMGLSILTFALARRRTTPHRNPRMQTFAKH